MTTRSNIKNLPIGPGNRYFTEVGYSDQTAWKEVSRSPSGKTIEIAPVLVSKDPDWKPEMHPGGFAAHCSNQSEQTWLYEGINGRDTRKIRQNKRGQWVYKGTRYIENAAVRFYDYNF